jgi:hypothetical protein
MRRPLSHWLFIKLQNVLRQFLRNVEGRAGCGEAYRDWQSDLEFVQVIKTLLGPNLRRAYGR